MKAVDAYVFYKEMLFGLEGAKDLLFPILRIWNLLPSLPTLRLLNKHKNPIAKKVMIKSLFSETLNVTDKSLGTNEILTEDLIVP
ncbi:hypothetical protein D1632_02245 [Chryseobacterium nematophagum]|uniref:Uncharacterized protein n=1 Tax=Chryseobacterium nematophagum TaxID=2305228 RepID=A0A3M7LFI8_9FLAO|nr:hypothetical protein [Chryseobacterium nematophagum]RMZ60820.1 hypothetical protein D1632_02245 [Chryseobacterium nematophagum]